jgi:hypothetical protein
MRLRMSQAEETLTDADRMVEGNFSPRTITNRAYYSTYYRRTCRHGNIYPFLPGINLPVDKAPLLFNILGSKR